MLYLDASALVKRYVDEEGSKAVRDAMADEDAWWICRIGFVETARAVGLAAGARAVKTFQGEWGFFGVVEIDAALAEHAATLALSAELRSLDALHLAAALAFPSRNLTLATWDTRLHSAARDEGLRTLPEMLG
jgi:predicted nucleic acid-binding protein